MSAAFAPVSQAQPPLVEAVPLREVQASAWALGAQAQTLASSILVAAPRPAIAQRDSTGRVWCKRISRLVNDLARNEMAS